MSWTCPICYSTCPGVPTCPTCEARAARERVLADADAGVHRLDARTRERLAYLASVEALDLDVMLRALIDRAFEQG